MLLSVGYLLVEQVETNISNDPGADRERRDEQFPFGFFFVFSMPSPSTRAGRVAADILHH